MPQTPDDPARLEKANAPGGSPGKPARRGKWWLLAVLALLGLSAAAGWLAFFRARSAPPAGLLTAAGYAPAGSQAVFAVENPAALLEAVKNATGRSAGLAALVKAIVELAGFDPTRPEEWAKAGLDVGAPVCGSLIQRGDRPELLFSVGLTNEDAAVAAVIKIVEKYNLSIRKEVVGFPLFRLSRFPEGGAEPGPAQVALADEPVALAVRDKRLFVLVLGSHSPGNAVSRLADILDLKPQETMAEDRDFRKAVANLPAGDLASLYLRVSPVDAGNQPPAGPLLRDVTGLALSLGRNEAHAWANLEQGAEALSFLRPGDSCSGLLSRFEPPLAAFSLSLENPVGLLRRLLPGADLQKAEDFLGSHQLSLAELEEVTRKGACGFLLYPGDAASPRLRWVGVVKAGDPEKAGKVIRAVAGLGEMDKVSVGEAVFFVASARPASGATREAAAVGGFGSYIVLGTAVDRIRQAVKNDSSGWTPGCGKTDLFAFQLFPARVREAAAGTPGAELIPANLPRGAEISGSLRGEEDGLRLSVRDDAGGLATLPLAALAVLGEAGANRHGGTVALLRSLAAGEVAYSCRPGNQGRYGGLSDLAAQGFADERFAAGTATVDGFAFQATAGSGTFRISAVGTGALAGTAYHVDQNLSVCTDPGCTRPLPGSPWPPSWLSWPALADFGGGGGAFFGKPPREFRYEPAVAMLRNIAAAELVYSSRAGNGGRFGSLADLSAQGLLDARFAEPTATIDGFVFRAAPAGSGAFTASAQGLGLFEDQAYYVNENLVVCTDPRCSVPLPPQRSEKAAGPGGP